MQLKFFLYIAVIFFLSLPVGATLTAPSTNHAGYKVWGNYWDMQGEAGVQNGYFIGIFNITDPTGHSYLKNNTFFCGSNTTCTYNANGSISISSIAGSSGGVTMEQVNTSANLYNINASNLTTGTIPSSVYGTGIYVGNISDYFSNLTSQGFVTNSTMDKNLSNGTGIIPSSVYGTGIYAANISNIYGTISFHVDNSGSVITNVSQNATAYYNGTLNQVTALGDVVGNISVSFWKSNYSTYPAQTLMGTISFNNSQKYQNSAFVGWTSTTFSNGDNIMGIIDSASNFTKMSVDIKVVRT